MHEADVALASTFKSGTTIAPRRIVMKNRRHLTPEMGMENKENQTNGISSSFVFSFRPYISGAGDPHIRQTTHLGDLRLACNVHRELRQFS